MAVSYVAASSGSSGSATSTSFATSLPSGWAAGDVAILVGHVSGGSLTISTPAGWTLLPGVSWPVAEGSASRLYAWSRVLQGGDTAPTLTNSGSVTGGWECTAYRGVSAVAQAATATASGTSVSLPTLTGVLAGSAVVAGVHCRVASGTIPTNLTHDAAYTEVVDQSTSRATSNANVRAGAAYRLIGSAGTYGGESVTSDVTGSMIGLIVELTAATVEPAGLSLAVAVGAPTVSGTLTAVPGGFTVPVTVGSPAVTWSSTGQPAGLTLPVEVGAPAVAWSATAAPDGLAVPVAVGNPDGIWSATAAPDGLAVSVAAGLPGGAWSATAAPVGLTVPVAVGNPGGTWSATAAPAGLSIPVAVGAPSAALNGGYVTRPDTGTVTRPSTGTVTRPDSGVVTRP